MLERFLGGLGPLDDERVKGGGKELVVAHVRSSHNQRKWPAIGLDQEASLHAVLAPVGGIRTDEVPPKRALPIAPSAACHSQFTPPNSSHSSTSAAQIRSSTPSSTHRWKARCTVDSSGNSLGRRFHWQPVRKRKITASKTARWVDAGAPGTLWWIVLFEDSARSSPTARLARA